MTMQQGSDTNVNYDLLKCIPPDAKLVLETGCGVGALGRAYKLKNPFARYIGIEKDEQAAVVACQFLDHVATVDVEGSSLSSMIGEDAKIDCLVYGNVLESLRDPWGTLQRHIKDLADDGQVVACIPNAQHWSRLVNLLRGQWQSESDGLLNKTQLRFFTLESIQQMFADAGLHIFEIIPRILDDKQTREQAQETLLPAAKAADADIRKFAVQTGALEYIVRASKRPLDKGMLLQSLLGETKVCARVRISEPHSFCRTRPGVRVAESIGTVDLGIGRKNEHKVLIWQRLSPRSFAQQEQLIERGYLSVYEIDDDPERWPSYGQSDYMSFRSCHAVQVSTESLAEYIRQFNPHVAVFPNQIAWLPPKRTHDRDKPLSIFFGAINREMEYVDIIPKINKILSEHKGKVQVTVIHDQKFFDALQTTYKKFVSFCPYTQYQQLMMMADIALLPLQYNRFNSMKSDLKFLECAAFGAVALASPTVYQESIQDGVTGLIYHNADEFAVKFHALLVDSDMRIGIANKAYEWVKENRLLCQHYKKRLEWYEGLFGQYEELTEGIYQRMANHVIR